MNGNNRSNIKIGVHVRVIQKQDQISGKLTEGIVKDILTKSASHPPRHQGTPAKRYSGQGQRDSGWVNLIIQVVLSRRS